MWFLIGHVCHFLYHSLCVVVFLRSPLLYMLLLRYIITIGCYWFYDFSYVWCFIMYFVVVKSANFSVCCLFYDIMTPAEYLLTLCSMPEQTANYGLSVLSRLVPLYNLIYRPIDCTCRVRVKWNFSDCFFESLKLIINYAIYDLFLLVISMFCWIIVCPCKFSSNRGKTRAR